MFEVNGLAWLVVTGAVPVGVSIVLLTGELRPWYRERYLRSTPHDP